MNKEPVFSTQFHVQGQFRLEAQEYPVCSDSKGFVTLRGGAGGSAVSFFLDYADLPKAIEDLRRARLDLIGIYAKHEAGKDEVIP